MPMPACAQPPVSLFLDLDGLAVDAEERELLDHPLVGGVILFSRNVDDRRQLCELVREIRDSSPDIVIAVDQEGGRVQRFREGFSALPPLRVLGHAWDRDPAEALASARLLGWLMAAEVRACDVDLSFAPVVDLDYGASSVIGDRALHSDAEVVAQLAEAYVDGMHGAGMAATAKHYPGHGYVREDSHLDLPHDERALDTLVAQDLLPFRRLVMHGLDAIMPAHVVYTQVDERPAGFSQRWLGEILRGQLGFEGLILSDDLAMAGAAVAGGFSQRAALALAAGCDIELVCNDRSGACEVLEYLASNASPLPRPLLPLRASAELAPDPGQRERAQVACERMNELWQRCSV